MKYLGTLFLFIFVLVFDSSVASAASLNFYPSVPHEARAQVARLSSAAGKLAMRVSGERSIVSMTAMSDSIYNVFWVELPNNICNVKVSENWDYVLSASEVQCSNWRSKPSPIYFDSHWGACTKAESRHGCVSDKKNRPGHLSRYTYCSCGAY